MKIKFFFGLIMTVFLVLNIPHILAETSYYYGVEFVYNNEKISINKAELLDSFVAPIYEDYIKGEYGIQILDKNRKTIDKKAFYFSNILLYDKVDERGKIVSGGIEEMDKFLFNVNIPYYENATEIVVYDDGGNEIDRVFLAKTHLPGEEESELNIFTVTEVNTKKGNSITGSKLIGQNNVDISSFEEFRGFILDKETRKIYIKNKKGENVLVRITPRQISDFINFNFGNGPQNIDIKKYKNNVVYYVQAQKRGKFLGLFNINMNVELEIDMNSGDIFNYNEPLWGFFVF